MKKFKTIPIILLLVVSNISFAQNLSIGIKDGISRSDIRFKYKNFDDLYYFGVNSLKGGRNYGLMLNYQITNFFSIQSELYHSERGFEFNLFTDMDGGHGVFGNYKMNYITIPIMKHP